MIIVQGCLIKRIMNIDRLSIIIRAYPMPVQLLFTSIRGMQDLNVFQMLKNSWY